MKAFYFLINKHGRTIDCDRYGNFGALGSAIGTSGATAATYWNNLRNRNFELEKGEQGKNVMNNMHLMPLGKHAVGIVVRVTDLCDREDAKNFLKKNGIQISTWS